MSNFLFKKFINDSDNINDPKVRDSYGKLAGIIGIASNAFLCGMKILIGIISGSIAIVADGINNLADASSSIITIAGFKMASLPEDKDHPYGHARIEYITGMVISIMIILVSIELGKSSVDKILNPSPVDFSPAVVIVLLIAIIIKVWQSVFNISAGKKINSLTLIATGTDSRNDVISTAVVLAGVLAEHFFSLCIDGYLGLAVAVFILWSGICLVKETISPLLGEAPDPQLVKDIENLSKSYAGILDIHDLVVHNYGPGKIFASIHLEVDASVDVMTSHELVDAVERQVSRDLGIHLTAHMDPIDLSAPHREEIINIINATIPTIEGVQSFHDLRMIAGPTHTNIIFDVVATHDCKLSESEIERAFNHAIQQEYPEFFAVIDVDKSFSEG